MLKKTFNYQGLLGEGNPLLRYPVLLEAAIDVFSHTRFEDASLNDILKKADMSKGSFYYNFGDKFGLYLAMVDIIAEKKKTFFIPFLTKRQNSGDFFATIRDVVRGTVEFMFIDQRLHHLSNRYLEVDIEIRNRIMEYFPYDFSKGFEALIISAIEAGQIDQRFTPKFVVTTLQLLFSNVHKYITPGKSSDEVIDIVNQMIDLMQHGISSKNGG